MQAGSLWNLRRPVWLHCLSLLLEPWLAPCVTSLLEAVEEGRTWTLAHLPQARRLLLTSLADLLPLLPPSLAHLLASLQALLPPGIHPLADSAPAHLLLAALYSSISRLLPALRKARIQKEKLDFLIAVCESLCTVDSVADLAWIQPCLEQELKEAQEELEWQEQEQEKEPSPEHCQVLAHYLLQEQGNKVPLQAFNRWQGEQDTCCIAIQLQC